MRRRHSMVGAHQFDGCWLFWAWLHPRGRRSYRIGAQGSMVSGGAASLVLEYTLRCLLRWRCVRVTQPQAGEQ
jgi:hypothetical protein